MKRKLCSVLLALCMVLTLLPVSAMADEADTQSATSLPAADENGVITLMENVTLTSTFVVNADQDLTLDLNGHSLTEAGTVILNNGRLTIRDTTKNGSIVSTNYVAISAGRNSTTTIEYANVRSVEGAVITSYATGATITIKDGVFSASDNAVIAGNGNRTDDHASGKPERVNPNTITINGGEFNGAIKTSGYVACGIYAPWKDNITVNGGTFNITGGAGIVARGGNVTVNGGTFNTTGNAIGKVGDSRVVVPCSALVFDSEAAYPALTNDSKITVNNGTFNSETSTISTMPKADDTNERVVVNSGTFSDLSALDYLAEGANVTVKLAADTAVDAIIPNNRNVNLDLNGKTLTTIECGLSVVDGATLTVSDSRTGGKLTSSGTPIRVDGTGSKAIINSGTIESTNDYGIYAKNNGAIIVNGGTVTSKDAALSGNNTTGNMNFEINGGTLTAEQGPAIYMPGQGKLTVTNGTLNGGISLRMGQVNISGGTINSISTGIDSPAEYYSFSGNAWLPDALYVFGGTYTSEDAQYGNSLNLNITGGTFNCLNDQGSAIAIYDLGKLAQTANVTISGGTFTTNSTTRKAYQVLNLSDIGVTAPKEGYNNPDYVGKVNSSLTGGTYSADPSKYVAPGYVASYNGSTYTVYYPVPVTPGNNNNSSSTTTKNPDGSTTTTTTDKTTGTVTETTKNPDGSTTTVETKKDGSVTETNKTAGGSVGTVKSDANGNSEISANISAADVSAAAKKNEPVAAPVSVAPAASPAAAPVIKLSVPASAGEVSVVIPVTNAQQGTVAIKVNPDGTEEIIKTSVVTKDGVVLGVKGSTQIKIVNNDKDFSDTVGHWAESDVDFVSARELFTGTAPQTFSPEAATTRGMVVTVLARLAGESTDGGANWYDKGCAWAVTNGVSDGTDPNGTVTREQLAAMLYRYFGSPAVSGSLSFADASSVSEYAHDAMQWCVNNGIINGMDGLLNPQGQATRAQVSAMFARYIRLAATK